MTAEDVVALSSLVGFATSVYGFVRVSLATERTRLWKSLALLLWFFLYCLAGFGLVWWLANPPAPESRAAVSTFLALLWIGYGGVWLARLSPKADGRKTRPKLRFLGPIDIGFALAGFAALTCFALL